MTLPSQLKSTASRLWRRSWNDLKGRLRKVRIDGGSLQVCTARPSDAWRWRTHWQGFKTWMMGSWMMCCGRQRRMSNVGVAPEKGVMLRSHQRHLLIGYDYMGKR